MSTNNPVRQVLLSSELNSIDVIIAACIKLITNDGKSDLNYMFVYTDNGIREMISDYYQSSINNILYYVSDTLFYKLQLTDDELKCKPFNIYEKYRQIFRSFASNFVDKIILQNIHHTQEIVDWFKKTYPNEDNFNYSEIIKRHIGGIYMSQVYHKMLSNPNILYIMAKYPTNIKNKNDDFFVDSKSFIKMINVAYATDDILIPLTKDLSFLIDNHELKQIYKKLYDDLNELDKNYFDNYNYIKLLKPSCISSSTGV